MTIDQEKIKARIRALRERRVDRGCTEAEAIAAAEAVARLMAEHGISESEVDVESDTARNKTAGGGTRDRLWWYIAEATNCAHIFNGASIVYFGQAPGPTIAVYLHGLLDRALDREIAKFKTTKPYSRLRKRANRVQAVREFSIAFIWRVGIRITGMFQASQSEAAKEIALDAMNRVFPEQGVITHRPVAARYEGARLAGAMAGNALPIHHGLDGGKAPEALPARPLQIGEPTR